MAAPGEVDASTRPAAGPLGDPDKGSGPPGVILSRGEEGEACTSALPGEWCMGEDLGPSRGDVEGARARLAAAAPLGDGGTATDESQGPRAFRGLD